MTNRTTEEYRQLCELYAAGLAAILNAPDLSAEAARAIARAAIDRASLAAAARDPEDTEWQNGAVDRIRAVAGLAPVEWHNRA